MAISPDSFSELARAYAFLGNSLLSPMSKSQSIGLDPRFWEAFPTFGDDAVAASAKACGEWALGTADLTADDAITKVAVEYTRLFVGPPSPAAAPWETFYRAEGVAVGFGQPTIDMRNLLAEAGLELRNENNQYEDHLGIELLYLSVLCESASSDAEKAQVAASFAKEHPLSWVDALRERVRDCRPEGYFDNLLGLVRALLSWQVSCA